MRSRLREKKDRFDAGYDRAVGRARSEAAAVLADRKAQGTNMVGLFIGLLIAAIVVVQVFIPVLNDSIANSSVTGTAATILELLPLFAALLLLIALAAPLMRRI